jgi:SAM-dependent methyltransferase
MITRWLNRLREMLYPAYARAYPFVFRMKSFRYEGAKYEYMFHPYGTTLVSERIVEVPIALEALRAHAGRRILEIGNVLGHYAACSHTVVDKYEKSDGCLSLDILDYRPSQGFDFVVSVSTVEHIGWNRYEREPDKAVLALEHMRRLLAPGGHMLVTVPLGYNQALDRYLQSDRRIFYKTCFLTRSSSSNRWVQASAEAAFGTKYGSPYPFANGLAVCYATTEEQAGPG